jgi:hypothetical protein
MSCKPTWPTPPVIDFNGREYKARILIKSDGNLLVSGNIDSAFLNHAGPRVRLKSWLLGVRCELCRRGGTVRVRPPKFLPVR